MVRSGPALFTGYHQAGAVGARSCLRAAAGPPVDRARPDVDAQTVGWLVWLAVGRAGPSAPLLLSPAGCRPRLLAAARPARSPAGAEGTGTAHRLGIGAHGFPGPLLAPAACSALASASYVPLWWRRAARDRVAEFARWKWNEPGGNVAPSGRSDENVCVSHGIACFSFLLLFWVLTLSE